MLGDIEELTDEEWKGHNINLALVFRPLQAGMSSAQVSSTKPEAPGPPPDLESFAFKTPRLKVKGPSRVIKVPPPMLNTAVLEPDDSPISLDTSKPERAEQQAVVSRRAVRTPARDRSYIYDDEDEEEQERPDSSSGARQPESVPKTAAKRRQLRVVSDDSSDDEYKPAAQKKSRMKRARRTMIDMDDDELDYPSTSNSVIDLTSDLRSGFSHGTEPKNVIMETLQRCERIAAVLRQELNASNSGFAPKIITQGEVQAACQSLGSSKDQTLSPYQLVGVNFLLLLYRKKLGGAILADEMGLGKTVQAIAFLALIRYLDGDSGPHLIVTPASVLENWQRELKKWCPGFTVIPFHGHERGSLKEELNDAARSGEPPPFQVFLTGYSLFERKSEASKADRSMLKKWDWSCVIMDEAHLLKDCTSYRNRNLRSVAQRARHRLMITGTPLQNDLQELWSLLEFMMPNIFKNCDFDEILENKNGRKLVAAENKDLINHIKGILGPFVLRRVKADVMHQLTPKVQLVQSLDMVDNQRVAYAKALNDYRALAATTGPSGVNSLPRRQISSIFTHLRKLANHPLLVRLIYTNEDVQKLAKVCFKQGIFGRECTLERVKDELENYSDYSLHRLCCSHASLSRQVKLSDNDALQSAKCQVLAKLLPELRSQGHRPLIFSQWTAMLDILEWFLQVLGIKYNRLDGSTQVSERQTLVDAFNNDSDIFAFLLSTRAGGQGLNLTGADTVIIHDVDFNPQMDRQAEDRCHRIGQSKSVTIYRLVTKATVDENIFAIAQRKLQLDAVLESSGNVSQAREEETKTMGQILSSILCSK